MKHYKYNIFISYSTKYFIYSDATYKMLPKNVNLSLLTPLINTPLKKKYQFVFVIFLDTLTC